MKCCNLIFKLRPGQVAIVVSIDVVAGGGGGGGGGGKNGKMVCLLT